MKAILTLLAALAFAGDSLLAPEFGGFDPNRFPIPQVNPPLQPIGFAFAIWFPIYAWLIASGVYGVAKRAQTPTWQAFRLPLILSTVIGTPWIRVARVSPLWSTVMIWAMVILALIALWKSPEEEMMWARGPVGLYAGWLTAASAVGTSVLLAGYGVMSQQTAAVVMLLWALALAVVIIIKSPFFTLTYSLAVMWALAGIVVNSLGLSNQTMVALASLGFVVIAIATWMKKRKCAEASQA